MAVQALSPFPTPSDADIQAAKSNFPGQKLRLLASHGASVIVRAPSEAEFARMQVSVADGGQKNRLSATNQLLRDVAVWPDRETVLAITRALPGVALTFVDDILDLMGIGGEVEKKDL
jgi:hypothetical protein